MTNEQLIIEVWKRKFLIITGTVIVFILVFTLQYRVLQTFKSSASIIVNETNVADLNGPSHFVEDFINTNASSVNRLFKFTYSTEMMNHLIKKFNLYKYYQIDSSSAFAYEKIVVAISNRIALTKSDPNMILITVTDKDRFQAASLANEVAMMLNVINENYIKNEMKRKVMLYEDIYENVKSDLDQHEDKMNKILENYKTILTTLEKNKVYVEDMRYSLMSLTKTLESKREELMKMKQLYAVTLEILNKEHLETITLINSALPDYHSNTNSIFIFSLAFSLVSTCVMILLLNVYLTHQKFIHLIFKK